MLVSDTKDFPEKAYVSTQRLIDRVFLEDSEVPKYEGTTMMCVLINSLRSVSATVSVVDEKKKTSYFARQKNLRKY